MYPFDGDFYVEPDNVTRGVTLGSAFDEGLGSAMDWREPNDFHKGVHFDLAQERDEFGSNNNLTPSHFMPHFQDETTEDLQPYRETHKPPLLPEGLLERPEEATSIELLGVQPWEAANKLYAFLRFCPFVAITKVRPKKYCLKASACSPLDGTCPVGGSCDMKVFVYLRAFPDVAPSTDGRRPATNWPRSTVGALVDFQRRAGCAQTFWSVLRMARSKLLDPFEGGGMSRSCYPGLGYDGEAHTDHRLLDAKVPIIQGDVKLPSTTWTREDILIPPPSQTAFVASLLDLARDGANVELQAEVATALQSAVEDDARAVEELYTPEAHAALELLLSAKHFETAYPTTRVLLALAKCPKATELFLGRRSEGGTRESELPRLTRLMLDKLEAAATLMAVKAQLALCLYCIIDQVNGSIFYEYEDVLLRCKNLGGPSFRQDKLPCGYFRDAITSLAQRFP